MEALNLIALEPLQQGHGFRGLNTFGHHMTTKRVRHLDNRLHQ